MSALDAAFRLAHGYPGGASALALRMQIQPAHFSHQLKAAGSAKLGLVDAVMLSHLANAEVSGLSTRPPCYRADFYGEK